MYTGWFIIYLPVLIILGALLFVSSLQSSLVDIAKYSRLSSANRQIVDVMSLPISWFIIYLPVLIILGALFFVSSLD
jgi:hypothetical protein